MPAGWSRWSPTSARAEAIRSIFGRENTYVEIQRHLRPEQERANRALIDYARWHGLPLLATNGVRYAKKSGRALFDVLTCLRHKTVLDQAGRLLDANAERHLKSPAEMARLFRDLPEAVRNTAGACRAARIHAPRPRLRIPALPRAAGRDRNVLPAQEDVPGRRESLS